MKVRVCPGICNFVLFCSFQLIFLRKLVTRELPCASFSGKNDLENSYKIYLLKFLNKLLNFSDFENDLLFDALAENEKSHIIQAHQAEG